MFEQLPAIVIVERLPAIVHSKRLPAIVNVERLPAIVNVERLPASESHSALKCYLKAIRGLFKVLCNVKTITCIFDQA